MTHGKSTPFIARRAIDRWAHVSFLSGKVAAGSGTANSSNPHPEGSDSAKDWLDGWNAHSGIRATPARPRTTAVQLPPRLESELMMDLMKRLPDLADADLGILGANATRLALSGTAKQKTAAQAALPAIQEELAARQAKKAAETAAKGTRSRRKAPVAATAAQPE